MKTKIARTKKTRDDASLIELNLAMAKAGCLFLKDVCKELSLPYSETHLAFYRGARRGRQSQYRQTVLDHLRQTAAHKEQS